MIYIPQDTHDPEIHVHDLLISFIDENIYSYSPAFYLTHPPPHCKVSTLQLPYITALQFMKTDATSGILHSKKTYL